MGTSPPSAVPIGGLPGRGRTNQSGAGILQAAEAERERQGLGAQVDREGGARTRREAGLKVP